MKPAYSVLYYATREGYSVTAYDGDMQPVEEYRAGNHWLDSQGVTDSHRAPLRQLRKWAKQTAEEMAREHGVPSERVDYDHDGERAEIEQCKLLSDRC